MKSPVLNEKQIVCSKLKQFHINTIPDTDFHRYTLLTRGLWKEKVFSLFILLICVIGNHGFRAFTFLTVGWMGEERAEKLVPMGPGRGRGPRAGRRRRLTPRSRWPETPGERGWGNLGEQRGRWTPLWLLRRLGTVLHVPPGVGTRAQERVETRILAFRC